MKQWASVLSKNISNASVSIHKQEKTTSHSCDANQLFNVLRYGQTKSRSCNGNQHVCAPDAHNRIADHSSNVWKSKS